MDFLCDDLHLLHMSRTSRKAKEGKPPGSTGWQVFQRALHDLDPNQAWQHPALFLLETVGALLTLLAFRDTIVGANLASIETAGAGALWIALLLANLARALRLMPRERADRELTTRKFD